MSPASTARPVRASRSGSGARAIALTSQKGAVLELSGRQVGLMAKKCVQYHARSII
jgi:hypothetical protein